MSVSPFCKGVSNLFSKYVLMGIGNKRFGFSGCQYFQGVSSQLSMNLMENLKPTQPAIQAVRTKVRQHLPRPKEYQKARRHGWEKRLSTPGGRAIIMRRILKGRHVLSH